MDARIGAWTWTWTRCGGENLKVEVVFVGVGGCAQRGYRLWIPTLEHLVDVRLRAGI